MKESKLSTKEQRFIEAYDGNATDAARKAGYKNPERSGAQNVRKRKIWDSIWNREKSRKGKDIADREERQIFWSTVMRDGNESMQNRLMASDKLAKSEGDYIERRDVNITQKDPLIIKAPDNGNSIN